jgi:sugar lactone lactonase YvrE
MTAHVAHHPDLAQRIDAALGEVPAWDAVRQLLIWVDIRNQVVHQWHPASARDDSIAVDARVGAAMPWRPGHLALAVAEGFGDLDLATGAFELLAPLPPADRPSLMNDAKCDRRGRYWGGTIALDLAPGAGKLYRLDLDGSVHVLHEGLHISNGLGWSPDDREMYLIDSFACVLFAFDFDVETGAIARQRKVIEVPPNEGLMDGLTVDQEGHIWVAMFGGSAIRCYAANGKLVSKISLPVTHPTSCVFGGPDLEDLFITTARQDENGPLDAARLATQPLAGSVLHAKPGVRGLPTRSFGGASMSPAEPRARRGARHAGGIVGT